MKKRIDIKRVQAKNGQIYYYQGSKRISAKKALPKYIKQQRGRFQENPELAKRILTDNEQKFLARSIAAKKSAENTFKFKGRPIQRAYALVLSKLIPKLDLNEKNMDRWINPDTGKPLFSRYSDILRLVDQGALMNKDIFDFSTSVGLFKNDNKQTNLIDIAEMLKDSAYNKYRIELIDNDGDEIFGRIAALNYIREFETMVTDAVREANPNTGVLARFNYDLKYNFAKKVIKLSLLDMNQDDPLDEIVASQPDYILTNALRGKRVFQVNKYQDATIQLFYS
jgi:hypothetical protein